MIPNLCNLYYFYKPVDGCFDGFCVELAGCSEEGSLSSVGWTLEMVPPPDAEANTGSKCFRISYSFILRSAWHRLLKAWGPRLGRISSSFLTLDTGVGSASCQTKHQVRSKVLINKNFQRNNANIFLPISFNVCFGCSKEPSH